MGLGSYPRPMLRTLKARAKVDACPQPWWLVKRRKKRFRGVLKREAS